TRLLPGDQSELVGRLLDDLAVLVGGAETHVHHDLLQTRDLHRVLEAQLLHQPGSDLFSVFDLEAGRTHSSSPHLRHMRFLVPSASTFIPMRVGPQSSHTIITFEMSIGMSRSMIPPCMVWPRGFSR